MALPLTAHDALFRAARWAMPKPLYPSALLRQRVRRATRQTVLKGPFAGMRFLERSIWGAYIPKLIGCYELEVHGCIERIIAKRPAHIVDIGGAEGYYAVGLLHRLREARLTVFDQLDDARTAIARLANVNGVAGRLSIRGACSPAMLTACLSPGTGAVICDVEGYEIELFDERCVEALRHTSLLIEVHDSRVPGCSEQLEACFDPTHTVERIAQQPRSLADYPYSDAARLLAPSWITKYALNEFRPPQDGWLWLEPRS